MMAMNRALPGSWALPRLRHSRDGSGHSGEMCSERRSSRKGRTAARDPVAMAIFKTASAYKCRLVNLLKNSSSCRQEGCRGVRKACNAMTSIPSGIEGTRTSCPAIFIPTVFAHIVSKERAAGLSIPGKRKWTSMQQGQRGWPIVTECLGKLPLSGSDGRCCQPLPSRASRMSSTSEGATKTSTSPETLGSRSPCSTLTGPLMKKARIPKASTTRWTIAWPRSTASGRLSIVSLESSAIASA